MSGDLPSLSLDPRPALLDDAGLRAVLAAMTALLTAGLVAWGIMMWQAGQASPGDLVLITALGFTILHGTRDLAVALVDLIQQLARLEEAISVLLVPHERPDSPGAPSLPSPEAVLHADSTTQSASNRRVSTSSSVSSPV